MFFRSSYTSGIISVVLASIFWGTTGTAASLIPDVSPLATGAAAMGLGGILLLCNAQRSLKSDGKLLLSQARIMLLGGISVAIYPLAFYSSMRLAGVAIGTLISIASAPFFTLLLEWKINNKAISRQWLLSFLAGTTGILLLTIGKQTPAEIGEQANLAFWGLVLGLIAGLTYASYSWAARQLIQKGARSTSAMASMFGLAALVLLPSLLFTGQHLLSDLKHITVIGYMAVIPMFVGYLCFGYALKQIDASKATMITLLEPAVATLFAVSIVGEKFRPIGWYGFAFIGLCLTLQVIKLPESPIETRT